MSHLPLSWDLSANRGGQAGRWEVRIAARIGWLRVIILPVVLGQARVAADRHLNSNVYVFILYLYNMYLKNHWFSVYGVNITFPFKINLFSFFKLKYLHTVKCMLLNCAHKWVLCNHHQYSFPEPFHPQTSSAPTGQ